MEIAGKADCNLGTAFPAAKIRFVIQLLYMQYSIDTLGYIRTAPVCYHGHVRAAKLHNVA